MKALQEKGGGMWRGVGQESDKAGRLEEIPLGQKPPTNQENRVVFVLFFGTAAPGYGQANWTD